QDPPADQQPASYRRRAGIRAAHRRMRPYPCPRESGTSARKGSLTMTVRNEFRGTTHEGMLRAEERRFAIVAARFNDFIVDKLIEGALDALRRTGADDDHVEIFRCPG